ncbi:hypothetical protein E4J66_14065 [Actinomyces viscosus]|uniref:Uncharacterized protein n=1 Tax=Actinomyces viscosus TaxID=1656 RepID=A0A448PMR5_ACTVI|nr:hypothetical protein [Actinomyces viscosus]TFH50692.1 hypothetical protein E4J66_14065 [Actinomyces viscosus]VEI17359.1 Uncharacterised protein [Actinomyces viscosus]
MRLLPPVVFTLATTVLVLTVGGGLFGWETSLLTPLSLLTVSLILLQAQHVQRAEPSQRIPGPSVLALSVIGLGLAIALLGYGIYNRDAAAAINPPSAGILLYVVVNARRQRRPAPQPVFVTTPEAPLAETSVPQPQ